MAYNPVNANGQATKANSSPVVIASDDDIQAKLTTIAGAVKAEDTLSANLDTGIPMLATRKATPANVSGTDGDYEFLQMSGGRLWASATIDAALPAGTNGIGKLTANSGVDIGDVDVLSIIPGVAATNLGKAEDAQHASGDTGVMALAVRSDTLAALAGTTADYTPFQVNSVGAVYGQPVPHTTNGLAIFRSIDLDETEEEIKATAGMLYGYDFANLTTGWLYLKFYNATAASTTVGTTTPIITRPIPPETSGHISFAYGVEFTTALCAAVVTGVLDNSTGAPAANAFVLNAYYK